jgi:ABC-type sugar transport system ATPase subunit
MPHDRGRSRWTGVAVAAEASTGKGASAPPVLELEGIDKHFDGVHAVAGVSFDVRPGEVHALVGENGAGKSTLMKIAVGYHAPDGGTVSVDGSLRQLATTRDAEDAGIAFIPQELDLFFDLSVAENLLVGRPRPRTRWGGIDRGAMERAAWERLTRLGAEVDVRATVRHLTVANRQIVAIARALIGDARVVVMDEPTAALSEREAERLFAIIEDLTSENVGVVYISHRLEEVFTVADRITVMRDGKHVTTQPASQLDAEELVRLMVGRPLSQLYTRHPVAPGEPALELRGLTLPGRFQDVDLTVHRGEVVGLAGLIGAGRTDLAQSVFGVHPPRSGEVIVNGARVTVRSPQDALELGLVYVPEERQSQGLILPFRIGHNITLSSLRELSKGGLVDRERERTLAERFSRMLDIRGAGLGAAASKLSGGNQQKVVLAKALARQPSIVLLDEPTRGIDVGAKAEIYRLIDQLAADGNAVLLISSELEEILALSDRILVMREGRLVGELPRQDATQERVMGMATGAWTPPTEGTAPHRAETA